MYFLANATPDQVFKSVGDTLDAQVNPNHLILIAVALVGMILLISFLTRRTTKTTQVKVVNNASKLTRQLARQMGLKSNEFRHLKQLADQENIDNPLVLLLCPSVLQAAMKKRQEARK